ncbi:MAG: GWxTD domain-containing protein [Bacteroidota bacterium]
MPSLRLRALTFCFAFAAAAPAFAQQPAAILPLQLDVDHAAFRYDAETSLVEAYLAFEASSLPYVRADEQFEVVLPVIVGLRRSSTGGLAQASETLAFADTLAYRFAVPDTSGLVQGQYFVQQVRAAVPSGEYVLEVDVLGNEDLGRAAFAARSDVSVPDFEGAGDRVMVSDLTLASSIRRSEDREIPFYKNGLAVLPNPNKLFGQGLPTLYYYAEAYGLDAAAGGGTYTLFAYLASSDLAQPMAGFQQRTERAARPTDVLVGQFDLSEVPSGSYYLRLALLDENNEALAEQGRKFFIFNPGVAQPVAEADGSSYEANLYAVMPEEEVEQNLAHAGVLANDREQGQMRRLATLDAKRDFLARFWAGRDENPLTPINETRRRFYELVQYTNGRYSTSFTEGWNTDRGNVVLKYGQPSQVDPNLYDSETVPHETWEYDNIPGAGRSLFVFVDRLGFGDFELIHSTVNGEVSMPDWQQQLRR